LWYWMLNSIVAVKVLAFEANELPDHQFDITSYRSNRNQWYISIYLSIIQLVDSRTINAQLRSLRLYKSMKKIIWLLLFDLFTLVIVTNHWIPLVGTMICLICCCCSYFSYFLWFTFLYYFSYSLLGSCWVNACWWFELCWKLSYFLSSVRMEILLIFLLIFYCMVSYRIVL